MQEKDSKEKLEEKEVQLIKLESYDLTVMQIATAEGEMTCSKPRAWSAHMVLEERT